MFDFVKVQPPPTSNKQIWGQKSSLYERLFLRVASSSKASLCPFFRVGNHPLHLANTEFYTNCKYVLSLPALISVILTHCI